MIERAEGLYQFHFNSHAHVERDQNRQENLSANEISTHTLTWSVTGYIYKSDKSFEISTHTLTWSVTCVLYR